ncbi:hypothetical protein BU24DRAFT_490348, partial [Aaosphaeria arxii CBS 175.79]
MGRITRSSASKQVDGARKTRSTYLWRQARKSPFPLRPTRRVILSVSAEKLKALLMNNEQKAGESINLQSTEAGEGREQEQPTSHKIFLKLSAEKIRVSASIDRESDTGIPAKDQSPTEPLTVAETATTKAVDTAATKETLDSVPGLKSTIETLQTTMGLQAAKIEELKDQNQCIQERVGELAFANDTLKMQNEGLVLMQSRHEDQMRAITGNLNQERSRFLHKLTTWERTISFHKRAFRGPSAQRAISFQWLVLNLQEIKTTIEELQTQVHRRQSPGSLSSIRG